MHLANTFRRQSSIHQIYELNFHESMINNMKASGSIKRIKYQPRKEATPTHKGFCHSAGNNPEEVSIHSPTLPCLIFFKDFFLI